MHNHTTLPDVAVNHRAEIPTLAFAQLLQGTVNRTLLLADSLWRREIMAGVFAEL